MRGFELRRLEMSRLLLVIVAALTLSGCGVGELTKAFYKNPDEHFFQARLASVYLGADLVSLMSTGKTVDDHIIGWATDQDCSVVRLEKGGKWCKPYPAPVAMVDVTAYCYKSLASTSCFSAPVASDQPRFTGSKTSQVPAP